MGERMLKKFYQLLQLTPGPFLLALILTAIVFVFCLIRFDFSFMELLNFWGNSLSSLHQFSMQMLLILVLGYVMAQSKPFQSMLRFCLRWVQTPGQAIVIATLLSCLFSYLNWGLGLVASALLAQMLKRKFSSLAYANLVASSYSGFLVWHGGLSGSIPLQLASRSSELKAVSGELFYPTSQTLFSHYNLFIVFMHVLILPWVNYYFYSRTIAADTKQDVIGQQYSQENKTISFWSSVEKSKWLGLSIGSLGLFFAISALVKVGSLDLNLLIIALLFLAIFLHAGLHPFQKSFEQSIVVGAGIVMLYPFYAGLMGLIVQSGFGQVVTNFFTQYANAQNLLLLTYFSAGFLNIFVPSGGGQWAIQAPIFLPLAQQLQVDVSRIAMMVAWGDAWTNMIQPFFALPLLSIAKIELGEIMPQCFWLFIASGIITISSIYTFF
jgi:short-chain fatty acids transporter